VRNLLKIVAVCGAIVVVAIGRSQTSAPDAGSAASQGPRATVDFSDPVRVGNALGFTHGGLVRLTPEVRARATARATQLAPGIWRGVPQAWSLDPATVRLTGAEPVVQLGDIWGLPGHWPAVWPDQNLKAYEAWIHARAENIKGWFPTGTVWVDVWNEPDNAHFWPILRDPLLLGYFSAFRVAERELRATLGSRVRVIGPSTATGASMWTRRLVDYCSKAGCTLDGIAWHANFQSSSLMAGLDDSMLRVRRLVATDPVWNRVVRSPLQFLITEYVSVGKRSDPGSLLSYWSQIEKGGGAKAAFAVWNQTATANGVLDSLLDTQGLPRPSWWAARAYMLGRTHRVKSSSSSALFPVLATTSGLSGKREVLAGSWESGGRWVEISMRGLPRGTLGLRVAVIPHGASPWNGSSTQPRWRWASPIRSNGSTVVRSLWVPGDSVVALSIS
jgi:hypothetical protein